MDAPFSSSKPSSTLVPVLSGSSTDFSVAGLVVLVVSAVESHTEKNALYSAAVFVAFGAGGEDTGHAPSPPCPDSSARLAVPTSRLLGSNRPPPEAPPPMLPTWFTTPQ